MDALSLIPNSVSLFEAIGLILMSLGTSFLTASVGIGGGTVLLAIMAQVLPVKALIPVHGVVQFGSNLGRAGLLFRNISLIHTVWFLVGSIIGAIVGGNMVVALPTHLLQLILCLFILYSVWGPKLKIQETNHKMLSVSGSLSTLLTMFVGATGPFVLTSLRAFAFSPQALVATSAACMVIQHFLKIVVFGFLGFAFKEYVPLIILMMVSGFTGTYLGRKFLLSVDERNFKIALNIVLTVLALRLGYSSLPQLLTTI